MAAASSRTIAVFEASWFDIAVYRKAATARLDEFVGPKA